MEFTKSQISDSPVIIPPPVDSEQDDGEVYDNMRVWIGNIDTGLSEFVTLKLLQSQGALRKFDFVYHKEGPLLGKPRGFCFATYTSPEAAQKTIRNLHHYRLNGRKLVVRIANPSRSGDRSASKPSESQQTGAPEGNQARIAALEAKLLFMDSEDSDNLHHKLIQSSLFTTKSQTLRENMDKLSTTTNKSEHSSYTHHVARSNSRSRLKNVQTSTKSTRSSNSKYKPYNG